MSSLYHTDLRLGLSRRLNCFATRALMISIKFIPIYDVI
jgi:hypothetical protein